MATTVSTNQPVEQVSFKRLLWVAPLTILAAITANFLIQQLAVAFLRPDPRFLPLSALAPIAFTLFGVLGAVIVFALAGRFASRPISTFKRIAVVALFLSFIPDLLMLATGFNPGTTAANVAVLIWMHVVAWAISVTMLTRLAALEGY